MWSGVEANVGTGRRLDKAWIHRAVRVPDEAFAELWTGNWPNHHATIVNAAIIWQTCVQMMEQTRVILPQKKQNQARKITRINNTWFVCCSNLNKGYSPKLRLNPHTHCLTDNEVTAWRCWQRLARRGDDIDRSKLAHTGTRVGAMAQFDRCRQDDNIGPQNWPRDVVEVDYLRT